MRKTLKAKIIKKVAQLLDDINSYKQALNETKEALISIRDSCRKYYSNQHYEECDTGYIKETIDKAKGN